MPGEEILIKVGIDAILGPVIASTVSKVLATSKQRKKCSSYYVLLLHGPAALKDEIARLGVEEGCWTESFVNTFRKANNIKVIDRKSPDELVREVVEDVSSSPDTYADLATGQVDDVFAKAIREANEELLQETLKK